MSKFLRYAQIVVFHSKLFCHEARKGQAIHLHASFAAFNEKDMKGYLKGCKFLPKLNNELEDDRNTTHKERFSSLNQLVLIMVRAYMAWLFNAEVCARLW